VLVCAAVVATPPLLVRRSGRAPTRRRVRLFVGWGCIAAWLLNAVYWMMPARFDLASSIPIHFCNVANIFGALAVVGRVRLFQGVIYFWAGLYIWAFLTPTVGVGPAQLGFWVFWIYHAFIALAFVHVLFIDRFRPAFSDLLRCSGFTLAYVAFLAVLDRFGGWNYGFLGDDTPSSPTLVDILGPYPLRIVWMVLIGAVVFFLLWLPFVRKPSHSPDRPTATMR
jgi:hypothetical integral membrane protein (TIGR02206 family)